jgi:hypothetical protein
MKTEIKTQHTPKREYCQWHETMETPAECSMKPTVAKHTPTPWEYDQVKEGFKIFGERDNKGMCSPIAETYFLSDKDKANAAFIVRTANCHDWNIQVMKKAMNVLSGSEPISLTERVLAYSVLVQAIAKAEGK